MNANTTRQVLRAQTLGISSGTSVAIARSHTVVSYGGRVHVLRSCHGAAPADIWWVLISIGIMLS